MPIYEFTCQQCGHRFEHLARTMNGNPEANCPECQSPKTSRALSVFAVATPSGNSGSTEPGMCGRCGAPGPCGEG